MKPTIKYGMISGISAGVWMFLQYTTGIYKGTYGTVAGYLFYVILFFSIFAGIKETRDKVNNGHLDIKSGLGNGLQVSAVSAIILALFTYQFWNWVPSDYVDFLVLKVNALGLTLKKSPEEIAQQIEQLKLNTEPFKQATLTIFNTMLPGIFSSIIFAFILRK